jgi:hypothetical protein
MPYTIYALFDEREPEVIRYVGFSRQPESRYQNHLGEARVASVDVKSHRLNWIRKVQREGARVLWRTLAITETADEAATMEIALIERCLLEGHRLVNGTKGGEGVQGFGGVLSIEAMARRNASQQTPEYKAQRSADSARYWSVGETREQQREAMKTFWASDEGVQVKQQVSKKARITQTGRKYSDESREKMRVAKLGKPQMPRTEEWKAKIAAAQKGKKRRPWTPEERERHMRGMNREKMSASAHARRGKSLQEKLVDVEAELAELKAALAKEEKER